MTPDGLFETSFLAQGEEVATAMPYEEGEYGYFCQLHPNMVGLISVTDDGVFPRDFQFVSEGVAKFKKKTYDVQVQAEGDYTFENNRPVIDEDNVVVCVTIDDVTLILRDADLTVSRDQKSIKISGEIDDPVLDLLDTKTNVSTTLTFSEEIDFDDAEAESFSSSKNVLKVRIGDLRLDASKNADARVMFSWP